MAITRIVVIKDYFKESLTIHFVRKKVPVSLFYALILIKKVTN